MFRKECLADSVSVGRALKESKNCGGKSQDLEKEER